MKNFFQEIKNFSWLSMLKLFGICFIAVLFLEGSFFVVLRHSFQISFLVCVLFGNLIFSFIISFLGSLLPSKIRFVFLAIILFLLGVLFSTQCVFYHIFKVYFSFYNIGLSDQIASFMKETFKLIFENILYILLFFIPFIITLVFHKKLSPREVSWKNSFVFLILAVLSFFSYSFYIHQTEGEVYGAYELYYNVNNISLNIKKIGVINSFYLDIKRIVFGFCPKEIKSVSLDHHSTESTEIVYEPNQLDLNFRGSDNWNIQLIDSYVQQDTPTLKNEYTGMFEGYNIVYITAESFSEIGIREDLTPTLYRLTHSGFQFENFYTPNNLSTIGGEFQSLTGLYPDYSILSRWREGSNYFPYGLANVFRGLGYQTFAYHNNYYGFQDRHQYLASQGFTNYLACWNGLENRMNCNSWPESDVDMINVTTSDYINSETPFLAYYMTVSGHFAYTFDDNSMALKHYDEVSGLDLGEKAKAYLATQIELDRALESLINQLEQAGKLEKTVIVMLADHYPYELDIDSINSISSFYRDQDVGVNHNSLIIWNSLLEDVKVSKPCMSDDVIPTIYNLFGVSYDSRLFTGRDILSTSFGIAIMFDRSWVTDKGIYHAATGAFDAFGEIEEGYVDSVNQLVNSRSNIAKLMIETDYYRYLFG